jgi:hypothetical protein
MEDNPQDRRLLKNNKVEGKVRFLNDRKLCSEQLSSDFNLAM